MDGQIPQVVKVKYTEQSGALSVTIDIEYPLPSSYSLPYEEIAASIISQILKIGQIENGSSDI